MNINTFMDKWDNGSGVEWGCSSGCSWNDTDDNEIYNEEVKDGGGYQKLLEDFRQLSETDQIKVAGILMYRVVPDLLAKTSANYEPFRAKFDNGVQADDDDNYFDLSEIQSGGGAFAFIKELDALGVQDPLAKLIISARLSDDAKRAVTGDMAQIFWSTYDNKEHDRVLTKEEINFVGDGKNFLDDLLRLQKSDALNVLDAVEWLPTLATLQVLKERFPEYTDRYNLNQFPKLKWSPYYEAQRAINAIKSLTGMRKITHLEHGALPPPNYELAISSNEIFYKALYDRLGSDYPPNKIDISDLAAIYNKYENAVPTATTGQLLRALNRNPKRYENVWFKTDIKGIQLSQMEEVVGYNNPFPLTNIEETDDNRQFLRKLRQLPGIKFDSYQRKKELPRKENETEARYKTVTYYTFKIPNLRTDFSFLVNSTDSASSPMILNFSKEYPRYEINTYGERVQENVPNDRMQAILFVGIDPVYVRAHPFFGSWTLEPDIDFANDFITSQRIY